MITDNKIELNFHHGGRFVIKNNMRFYDRGREDLIAIDPNYISYPEIISTIKNDLRYYNVRNVYYTVPWGTLTRGLKVLKNDADVLYMVNVHAGDII